MNLLIPVFALLGLFVGSFLNVCIDRLPKGQSIIFPPSHCAECQHKLGFFDLFPLFSFLWLRGRCRYCRTHIAYRIPIVEGVTGLIFALLYWKSGLGVELVVLLTWASLLVVIFVIDLEHQLVLNKVTYPAMVFAVILAFLRPHPGIASAIIGGISGLAIVALIAIIYPAGMGWGDAKMAGLVGLMVGSPLIFVAILLWWTSGGVAAVLLLAAKIKKRKDAIPFAPFLAISAMVTLLWGQAIFNWYTRLFLPS